MSSRVNKEKATKRMIEEEKAEAKKMGRPRHFASDTIFEQQLDEYLNTCYANDNRIPTLFGFARFTGTTSETVRMCEDYFPSSYKKMLDSFQDAIVNCKHTKNNMGIFVLKDNFKWTDGSQQSALTVNYNNVSDGQLERWLADANLKMIEED